MVNNIVLSGMAWVSSIKDAIAERISEESGQDLIEYAVLVGAIGVAAAFALFTFPGLGTALGDFKNTIAGCISFDSTTCKP